MALISCAGCQEEISDEDEACPHCGAPRAVVALGSAPARPRGAGAAPPARGGAAAEATERDLADDACHRCGAALPALRFACAYCGTLATNRVRTFDPAGTWERQRELIENNLDALRELPRPSARYAVTIVLWWYCVLPTAGIVALFWRRPKPAAEFQRGDYDKLTAVVSRNIEGIRRMAAGERSLLEQLEPLESEFAELMAGFARAARTRVRTIVAAAVVLAAITAGAYALSERNKSNANAVPGPGTSSAATGSSSR
ncbi:MAG: hypothetical protein IT373_24095 [Polyangiaceae bacterium]|nr:hypothetical protein [Polyangiaceae bacterium]